MARRRVDDGGERAVRQLQLVPRDAGRDDAHARPRRQLDVTELGDGQPHAAALAVEPSADGQPRRAGQRAAVDGRGAVAHRRGPGRGALPPPRLDNQERDERGRDRRQPGGDPDRATRPPRRQPRRRATVAERPQQALETLDLGIRLAPLVEEIVTHDAATFPSMPSLSRKSFIPRCKLMRTEPGSRPVTAAISGPLMPSHRRMTNVSRYASGRLRIASST